MSIHELGFVLEELFPVNIRYIVTLDIHAFICVAENSRHDLVASALVREGIAYKHADAMVIFRCSIIESSSTIVLVDKVNRVAHIGFYIHLSEVFVWSFHGDLRDCVLFIKFAVQRFVCIDDHTSTLSVFIDLFHDLGLYTKLCSQVNLRLFNLVFILSTN